VRKAQKQQVVEGLQEALRQHADLFLADYRGLTVKEMTELRRSVAQAGGRVQVVKNRLLGRALGEGERAALAARLEGPVAAVFAGAEPLAVLKALADFARRHEDLALKSGWFEGRLLGGGELVELSTLPPREELLAKLLGALNAPLSQLVGALQGVPRELVLTLEALARQRQAEAAPA